ncbi:MAG: hypothetical protein AAFY28_16175, partial [Actinomycetota bacterium]
TLSVTTVLDAPAEVVWPAVQTPHAFVHVARGLVRYPAAERVEGPWEVGMEISGWTFLFGVVPFSIHTLCVEAIDHDAKVVISDEHGGAVRTWRHRLITTPIDATRCSYEDRVDIDAGVLTPVVYAFAWLFYRGRQRRWRTLAPILAAASQAARAGDRPAVS